MSSNKSVVKKPAGWGEWSRPNIEELPKWLLSLEEMEFVLWLTSKPEGKELFTALEIAQKVRELWGKLFEGVSSASIAKNLYRRKGKHYLEREYYDEKGKETSLRLFSKGLLRAYRVPAKRGYKVLYGYPKERYLLREENFESKQPPHDFFARWSYKKLKEGVEEGIMSKASEKMLQIAFLDGSGHFVCDNCYRLTIDGKASYLWVEIHTGKEGYDEKVFIKRLVTMEQRINHSSRVILFSLEIV